MPNATELAATFERFAQETASRAPLYSRLSHGVRTAPEIIGLVQVAPEHQQLPVLLFAAVHDLLLSGVTDDLGQFYPTVNDGQVTDGDPWPVFRAYVGDHRERLGETISTRSTQTNEVGRCALFLPALGLVADEVGVVSLVDIGTSSGLNLLLDRYHYRYNPGREVGPESTVVLECGVRGPLPVPTTIPLIGGAIGLDSDPIDVRDTASTRWLEACVWPDQLDRFERLDAALTLARSAPPDVRTGDALGDLAATVREAAEAGHPVVLNSWVLNYLSADQRTRYVAILDELGRTLDLSWVIVESPLVTPELPIPHVAGTDHLTVVSLVTWRSGTRQVRRLGSAHPHGFWFHADNGID